MPRVAPHHAEDNLFVGVKHRTGQALSAARIPSPRLKDHQSYLWPSWSTALFRKGDNPNFVVHPQSSPKYFKIGRVLRFRN
jgi:hypothetical protein